MPEQSNEPTIHVDSDWKAEAEQERQKLVDEEKGRAAAGPATTDRAFVDLLNMLGMQVALSLGGYQGPGGQEIPADLNVARQQIAMLEALQRKTESNLSDEEKRGLDDLMHGLRMQYVQLAQGGGQPPGGPAPQPPTS